MTKLRTMFPGYCPPSEDDFKKWWAEGLFVFEANALLDLYGLAESTRTELFAFMESVKDRVWIPHQVAYEYHKNRIIVIEKQISKYKAALARLEKMALPFQEQTDDIRAKLLAGSPSAVQEVAESTSDDFEALIAAANEASARLQVSAKELINKLKKAQDALQDWISNDPILDRLSLILGDNVGEPYESSRLTEVFTEGKNRYDADPPIPPGYKDKDNKSKIGNAIYGDLVLWLQIIDKAQGGIPILLVSGERKEDWVEDWGDSKRPRRELVEEIHVKADSPFFMYSLTQLMENAGRFHTKAFSRSAIINATNVEEESADLYDDVVPQPHQDEQSSQEQLLIRYYSLVKPETVERISIRNLPARLEEAIEAWVRNFPGVNFVRAGATGGNLFYHCDGDGDIEMLVDLFLITGQPTSAEMYHLAGTNYVSSQWYGNKATKYRVAFIVLRNKTDAELLSEPTVRTSVVSLNYDYLVICYKDDEDNLVIPRSLVFGRTIPRPEKKKPPTFLFGPTYSG